MSLDALDQPCGRDLPATSPRRAEPVPEAQWTYAQRDRLRAFWIALRSDLGHRAVLREASEVGDDPWSLRDDRRAA